MADQMNHDKTMRNTAYLADEDDGIQHGIDDDPNNDAAKGAAVGGIGGAVTGAIAGSMVGPAGAVIGAVIGGVAGAGLSGVAVAAVDQIDNDDNVSGLGDEVHHTHHDAMDAELDEEDELDATDPAHASAGPGTQPAGYHDRGTMTGGTMGASYDPTTPRPASYTTPTGATGIGDVVPGNAIPGIQTGGRAADGTPDTRGMTEKAADAITGDSVDDKTGKTV